MREPEVHRIDTVGPNPELLGVPIHRAPIGRAGRVRIISRREVAHLQAELAAMSRGPGEVENA